MTIEDPLFEYDSVDAVSLDCSVFGNVTLKAPIGRFPAGAKVKQVVLNYGESQLEIWDWDEDGSNERGTVYSMRLVVDGKEREI